MNIQHDHLIISRLHFSEEDNRHLYMQNSNICYCLYGQRHALAPLLPCTGTSSSHGLGLRERPEVAVTEPGMELTMKACPSPQGGIQPLASHALLPGAFTSFAYLAWDLVKAAREERVLSHCSAPLSALGTVAKM